MTFFPAINTILSPEHLKNFVIETYGLNPNTQCRVLKTGINDTYLITEAKNKYVLRIYSIHWRTKNEIEAELKHLELLKENQISVSYPIKDKNSNHIQCINAFEGERFAVLFSYAEGETIKNPSEKACFNLGLVMAKMHLITMDNPIERIHYDANSLVNWALQSVSSHFNKTLSEIEYIRKSYSKISSEFDNADKSKLRFGAIHLDLWYDNMKIKDDTEITFFDFDNCGNGWLFLDIAYSVMLLFRNEPDTSVFDTKIKSFYEGYESITPISSEEKRLIPYGGLAIWIHYSGIHAHRFNDFSSVFFSEDFMKYWIQTVNRWMAHNNIKI